MIMIVDVTQSTASSLTELTKQLQSEGEARGLKVNVQHEDIFEFMHRV